MRYFTIKKETQHSFKKRYTLRGTYAEFFIERTATKVYTLVPCRFEFIYWRKLKRILKRLIKRSFRVRRKSRHKFYKKTAWVFLKPNFPISRKSKNSRMGKGIGSFTRWSMRLRSNHLILKVKRLSPQRVKTLTNWLSNSLNIPFFYN